GCGTGLEVEEHAGRIDRGPADAHIDRLPAPDLDRLLLVRVPAVDDYQLGSVRDAAQSRPVLVHPEHDVLGDVAEHRDPSLLVRERAERAGRAWAVDRDVPGPRLPIRVDDSGTEDGRGLERDRAEIRLLVGAQDDVADRGAAMALLLD